MFITRTVKNINRIGEVINILMKYSFIDIIANTKLKQFVSTHHHIFGFENQASFETSRWERIRSVIEELGPTFIKLAQLLSNRPDILPQELIDEFVKLQSNVPPFSTKTAKAIVEKEFKKPIDKVFSYFDNLTIGSASIGQVHRARLISGEDVVVKIQRPEAQKKVETDLRLLREFVKLTENYFIGIGILNPIEIVDTFEDVMRKELDYTTEARSIEQFRTLYKNQRNLHIPKPHREYTTSKVLVMEFISGCEITNIPQLTSWGLKPEDIALSGIDIYIKQIFEFGYFHADPHPGNILVQPNGIISLIDFGMIGKLTKRQKHDFTGILINLSQQDAKGMAAYLSNLATDCEIVNMASFENDLQEIIDDFIVTDVDQMGMTELAGRLQKIIYTYHLHIPGSIFLILRALAILEGIGKILHPQFNALEFIKPYGIEILKERYSLSNIKSESRFLMWQMLQLFSSAPSDIKHIIKKVRKGEIKSNLEIIGFELFLKKIDSIANRFVLTLLISSLLISSALIAIASPQGMPTILGIPLISYIGFVIACILAFWLLIYIISHRIRN